MIPLRLVVGVVERRGDRVAVGGSRLTVRDLREQAGKFLDSRAPLGDARTRRVRQERRRVLDLAGGLALGLAGGDPAADDARPAIEPCPARRRRGAGPRPPLGNPQGDRDRDLAGGREVAIRRAVRPGGALPRASRSCRLGRHERIRGAGVAPSRWARWNRTRGFRQTTTARSAGSLLARATDSSNAASLGPFRPADGGLQGVPGRDLNLARRQDGGLLLVARVARERALPPPKDCRPARRNGRESPPRSAPPAAAATAIARRSRRAGRARSFVPSTSRMCSQSRTLRPSRRASSGSVTVPRPSSSRKRYCQATSMARG